MTDIDLTVRKHTATGHRLPLGNGWSGGTVNGEPKMPYTYCGHCKGYFEIDEDWLRQVFVKKRKRLEAQQVAERASLDDDEQYWLKQIKGAR